MNDEVLNPIQQIQAMIDSPGDLSEAPPFVRGMDLSGLVFKSVSPGRFDMEWTVGEHLTHYDGIVQGGVINVVADTGQSFAFWTTSTGPESYSTSEFTTRFFRPIKAGDVVAVHSEVINRSRRICVLETRLMNRDSDKLCAIVTGSWMIVNRDFDQ